MKNFIAAEFLDQLDDVVLIDVRADFTNPSVGRKLYDEGHLTGAYYLDLNEDLSSTRTGDSGNHPLPDVNELKHKLEHMGISNSTLVVVYDDGSNAVAARAWFTLKYIGLERVKVLSGGFRAASKILGVTEDEPGADGGGLIEVKTDESLLATYEEVLAHSNNPTQRTVLVDSRSEPRFEGKEEHLYRLAGHIPGAENLAYSSPYDENGHILGKTELETLFSRFEEKDDVILSCGSGVSACANFIAMDEIGLKPRLYVGSYSQWLEKGNKVE